MPQFLSTLNSNLELHVIVHRTSSQTEVRSPSVSIPFYPSFFVHQNEVVLSLQQREMELMVEGVEGVLRALQVSDCFSHLSRIFICENKQKLSIVFGHHELKTYKTEGGQKPMLSFQSMLWESWRGFKKENVLYSCGNDGKMGYPLGSFSFKQKVDARQ